MNLSWADQRLLGQICTGFSQRRAEHHRPLPKCSLLPTSYRVKFKRAEGLVAFAFGVLATGLLFATPPLLPQTKGIPESTPSGVSVFDSPFITDVAVKNLLKEAAAQVHQAGPRQSLPLAERALEVSRSRTDTRQTAAISLAMGSIKDPDGYEGQSVVALDNV